VIHFFVRIPSNRETQVSASQACVTVGLMMDKANKSSHSSCLKYQSASITTMENEDRYSETMAEETPEVPDERWQWAVVSPSDPPDAKELLELEGLVGFPTTPLAERAKLYGLLAKVRVRLRS
jgi:hypothetical protein